MYTTLYFLLILISLILITVLIPVTTTSAVSTLSAPVPLVSTPILVINLKHRTDRLTSITKELKRMGLWEQTQIVEGDRIVAHRTGTAGVASSHAKCLKLAKERSWEKVIILQDDCLFLSSRNELDEHLQKSENIQGIKGLWFGAFYQAYPTKSMFTSPLTLNQDTATLIFEHAYDEFIQYYEFCRDKYLETGNVEYNCDMQFYKNPKYKSLKNGIYVTVKKLCGQADDMSDRDFRKKAGGERNVLVKSYLPQINTFSYVGQNTKNFGDAINNLFFDFLGNDSMIYKDPHKINHIHYSATGSILHFVNKFSIVYGTGFISEDSYLGTNNSRMYYANQVYQKPYKILSVRGPKTRSKLLKMGVECPEVYGDPLILFPLMYNPVINFTKNKIGIIPPYIDKNHKNLKLLNSNLQEKYSTEIIDIETGCEYQPFINKILESEYIVSSSLHGVIMGVVYQRKTIWVEFSSNVIGSGFKFHDFFGSLNTEYNLKNEYNSSILENIIKVDYTNLTKICSRIIEVAPFIENKKELINRLKNIYFFDSN